MLVVCGQRGEIKRFCICVPTIGFARLIGIDGRFSVIPTVFIDINDPESIKRIPWDERKQLIAVLDAVKQAEHVSKPKIRAVTPIQPKTTQSTEQPARPAAKASAQDIDALMSQLIIEDRKNQPHIPDRSVVIKWMLLIIVVIVVLSFLF